MNKELLDSVVSYCPETGIFIWESKRGCSKKGDLAGSIQSNGYVVIRINRVLYRAHRLAWLYVYGVMPAIGIDHIDGNRQNNAISNLRLANHSDNAKNQSIRSNNKSGFKGVSWHKKTSKWSVQCSANGKRNFIGYFDSVELAGKAYAAFAKTNHGVFYKEVTL